MIIYVITTFHVLPMIPVGYPWYLCVTRVFVWVMQTHTHEGHSVWGYRYSVGAGNLQVTLTTTYLEGANEGLDLGLRERANVVAPNPLLRDDGHKLSWVGIKGRAIGRGKCSLQMKD